MLDNIFIYNNLLKMGGCIYVCIFLIQYGWIEEANGRHKKTDLKLCLYYKHVISKRVKFLI